MSDVSQIHKDSFYLAKYLGSSKVSWVDAGYVVFIEARCSSHSSYVPVSSGMDSIGRTRHMLALGWNIGMLSLGICHGYGKVVNCRGDWFLGRYWPTLRTICIALFEVISLNGKRIYDWIIRRAGVGVWVAVDESGFCQFVILTTSKLLGVCLQGLSKLMEHALPPWLWQ